MKHALQVKWQGVVYFPGARCASAADVRAAAGAAEPWRAYYAVVAERRLHVYRDEAAALKAPASLTLRLSARPARRVHVAGAGPALDAKPPSDGKGGFFPALFGDAGALDAIEAAALLQFVLRGRVADGAGIADVRCPLAVKDSRELARFEAAVAADIAH